MISSAENTSQMVFLPLAKAAEEWVLDAFYGYSYNSILKSMYNNYRINSIENKLDYLIRKIDAKNKNIRDFFLKLEEKTSVDDLCQKDGYFQGIYQQFYMYLRDDLQITDAEFNESQSKEAQNNLFDKYLRIHAYRCVIFFCLEEYLKIKEKDFQLAENDRKQKDNELTPVGRAFSHFKLPERVLSFANFLFAFA
jgi:hypothetical protein